MFGQALEAASANLQFTLTGEAREEVRDILNTYVASVNETRLGTQRYLSTDDPQAATRVRRAIAQGRVHARRLVSASEGPLQPDMRRLAETRETLGTEAEAKAMLALASRVLEIRTGTIQTARERLLAAEARAADATVAMQGMIRSVWMVEAVAAAILLLSSCLTSRAIGTPLRRLAEAVRSIVAGRLPSR